MLLATKLTEEQRLQKCVVDIMRHDRYMWAAGALMLGKIEVVEDIPTAQTNGIDIKFGRAFAQSLTDAELRFVLLHELYHKIYKHLTTWRWMYDKDGPLANAACDYNINGKLVDENKPDKFATMPVDDEGKIIGLYDEKYRIKGGWMDSAAIFKALQEDGKGTGNVSSPNDSPTNGQPSNELPQGFDEHDWEGAQEIPAEEQRKNEREIDEALRQGVLAAGKMGSGGNRSIDELLAPQVNWRDVLREFVNDTCRGSDYSTWKRPNRRYIGAGVYMPSGITETVDELVLACDTSGSIGQRELTVFLSEVAHICETVKPKKIRVLYWDTQVCREEVYEQHEIADLRKSTKPEGGGGTDVTCVTRYIQENGINPQAVIVFTDGYLGGDWGRWNSPLLWLILDNKRTQPSVGSTVHLDSSKL